MGEAFFWGLIAATSLLIGGVLALTLPISKRTLGMIMGFGSGVLISAVAYELALEAFETSEGGGYAAAGLFAGSIVFYVGDRVIEGLGGADRKNSGGAQASGSPLAIVLGIVLDGIPESMVIGVGLIEGNGVSVAVLAAVFLSNLPEALAATTGLSTSGWRPAYIMGLWAIVALVSGIASLVGYSVFTGADPDALAFVLAFAGGAVLTMLADTMMPEAFEHGGRLTGVVTTLGFAVAFGLSTLE
jgi:zinc transporter, ZIP family